MEYRRNSLLNIFYKILANLGEIFSIKNLPWHLLAIVSTFIFTVLGFDWAYFQFFRDTVVYSFFFPLTAIIGGLLPILLPLGLYIWGLVRNSLKILNTSFALAQAAMLGSFVSSLYKAFTGRLYPPQLFDPSNVDISRIFQFGVLRGGVFWGWPSSHTTIAFAMAVALVILFRKNKFLKTIAWIYAFYIGIGVSISIHWFSDFTAGIIFGCLIGYVVGRTFLRRDAII